MGYKTALRLSFFLGFGFVQLGLAQSTHQRVIFPADQWYQLTIADQAAGFIQDSLSVEPVAGSAVFHSFYQMKTAFNRMGSKLEMQTSLHMQEDTSGKLIELLSTVQFSEQQTVTRVRVQSDHLLIETSSGGKTFAHQVHHRGPLVGLAGIRRLTQQVLQRVSDSLTYQTYSPELNRVISIRRQLIAIEPLTILGHTQQTYKVTEQLPGLPLRTLWLSSDYELVKSEDSSPFGRLVLTRSSRQAASQPVSGLTNQYSTTIARSTVRLPHARSIDFVRIKLQTSQPKLGFPDFQSPYQRVVEKGADYVVLEVTRPQVPTPAKSVPQPAPPSYRRANAQLDSDDSLAIHLARQIIGQQTDPFQQAILIRNWVMNNLQFDLGIVFAPSQEILRQRKGTCVSYATALATLARAAGIPARFLMGYVYLNGMWGGHAWAELYLHGQWIPFDGAIPSESVADAARFYFAASAMENGMADVLTGGTQLYGNVQIEVLAYGFNGQIRDVKPQTKPYTLQANHYQNAVLGLFWKKPDSFVFRHTDGVWPDDTLVGIMGKKRIDSVYILQRAYNPNWSEQRQVQQAFAKFFPYPVKPLRPFSRPKTYVGYGRHRAVAYFRRGTDVFLVVAGSKQPKKLLHRTIRSLSLLP